MVLLTCLVVVGVGVGFGCGSIDRVFRAWCAFVVSTAGSWLGVGVESCGCVGVWGVCTLLGSGAFTWACLLGWGWVGGCLDGIPAGAGWLGGGVCLLCENCIVDASIFVDSCFNILCLLVTSY